MGRIDNLTSLDNSTFVSLGENLKKSKALNLIKSDAAKDSHVIAERMKDRSKFLEKSNTLKGDAFDMMSDSYAISNRQQAISEEKDYNSVLENRLNNLQNSMNENYNQQPQQMMTKSNLPKEILDTFGVKKETQEAAPSSFSSLVENRLPANSSIDYDLIKSIVESSVKKYANALNKKMITENKNLGNSELKAMKIGKSFSFINENGDVYEAVLKYKGNINKKK